MASQRNVPSFFCFLGKFSKKLVFSFFQTCPMKGRPEQSFLDQFSERFMDHVRQVKKKYFFSSPVFLNR